MWDAVSRTQDAGRRMLEAIDLVLQSGNRDLQAGWKVMGQRGQGAFFDY